MPRASLTGRRRVSGEVVLVSGQPVDVSGSFVYTSIEITSGTPVGISGQVVKISGETVYLESGTGPIIAKISGETVIAKVSGEAVKVSGETVVAKISGETVIAKISGEAVRISGETVIAKVSGEAVKVSGEVVYISGQVVDIVVPTTVKTGGLRTITGASGGEVLHSGAVVSVTVKALADNSSDIYVGGATDRPYSGFGFLLAAGEAVNLDVDDFDDVYLCAAISGDKVTFLGIA